MDDNGGDLRQDIEAPMAGLDEVGYRFKTTTLGPTIQRDPHIRKGTSLMTVHTVNTEAGRLSG